MLKEAELLKEPVQQVWVSYPAAERFSGLSHTTLWRYVGRGDLKAARIGRSVRIHLPTLREFMEERASETVGSNRPPPTATREDGKAGHG